ncbi:MAG: hypothetical protein JO313_02125 [Verrucomicrobia bacterium]|nr:hypothetical protein [Verrucomicrobiota bacterium]MBV9643878.1 hypothetical protein [Verrucomicrobiota bacterium]
MRFFLTTFLVTLGAYAFISFIYPSESTFVPRLFLMWAAPVSGTLAGLFVTRKPSLGIAFAAQALALYAVTGIYCAAYHERAIADTLQYVTSTYFLPGAMLALVVESFARRF